MKFLRRHFLIFALLGLFLIVWLGLLGLLWWYQPPVNYSLIEEGLYLGGYVDSPPPGTRAVLNLCEIADKYSCDECLWESIPDAEPAPGLDWLRKMVEFIDKKRQAGLTTYVHCRNGVSRSGMVVTAYLMYKHNWTRDQALEFIRTKRPQVRPNPVFMDLLKEWEHALHDPATSP